VAPVAYPGDVTYGGAFTVQPFGNSLVTMTLTQQQIKTVLEQQFNGCLGQTAQRIMQISVGFTYTWNSAGTCGTRIVSAAFTPTDLTANPALPAATGPTEQLVIGGVVQNPTKTYRVTVNNFMATGGDGFTTFLGGLNVLGGAQDIDALVAYLASFKSPAAAYDPTSAVHAKPRIVREGDSDRGGLQNSFEDRGPRDHTEFADATWFKLSIGRAKNADPKWLLPLICRIGVVTKKDIGQIRIFDNETKFQISEEMAGKFMEQVLAHPDKDVRVETTTPPTSKDFAPRKPRAAGYGDRAERPDRPDRGDRSATFRPGLDTVGSRFDKVS
jgi:hypothetical protein